MMSSNRKEAQEFAHQAQQPPTSFLGEYVQWLRHNKKWWLAPILLGLFLMGFFYLPLEHLRCPFHLYAFLVQASPHHAMM